MVIKVSAYSLFFISIYYIRWNMKNIDELEIKNINEPLIIDLREKKDFNLSHINGSYNIKSDNVLGFVLKYKKDKNILFKCYTGHQSNRVGNMLLKLGYKNIYILK